jgi:hypothetical protein
MFIEDMLFCMKRIKTKWKPATENGIAVKMNYKIKINFISDHFDMTKLKTMRKILLLFLFFVSFFKAQETIPFNHNNDLFYKGGFVNFIKKHIR